MTKVSCPYFDSTSNRSGFGFIGFLRGRKDSVRGLHYRPQCKRLCQSSRPFSQGKLFGEVTDRLISPNLPIRQHIFDSIKASLERLQVDYVDVLQCHR